MATPGRNQGGNLETQRFSGASRHQYQRIAASNDMFYDCLLLATEFVIAEYIPEYLPGRECLLG